MRQVEGSSETDGEVAGVATGDVERRDAAMVRRRWDSVLSVAEVMQAARHQQGGRCISGRQTYLGSLVSCTNPPLRRRNTAGRGMLHAPPQQTLTPDLRFCGYTAQPQQVPKLG